MVNSAASFNQILEMIDSLSSDETDDLLSIVRHRQTERRRAEIALNIGKAHQEHQEGSAFRGTIDDVLTELNQE